MKLIAATALTGLLASPVYAMQCVPRDALVKALTENYGKALRSIAIADGGGLMEMYVNEAGDWTFTVTVPDGSTMCVVSGGIAFEMVTPSETPDGEPA